MLKLGIRGVTKLRRLFVILEHVETRMYAHTIEVEKRFWVKLVLSLSTCRLQETAARGS